MQLKPSEIESVDQIGELEGAPVKMVKTKGGFYIALGRSQRAGQEEALAGGSHPAIVKYNIEKKFRNFQPAMEKSESFDDKETVIGLSELIAKDFRQKGYDMYALKKGEQTSYIISQYNNEIVRYETKSKEDGLYLSSPSKKVTDEESSVVSRAIVSAALQEASELGKTSIVYQNTKITVK
jgi:hypothetical protein